ncbi:hypothetical protein NPIL_354421 [Nephila pilipes]|uniref:Uncharacterized protein n=1 Tax=Nephila pilipes TaxID=299642 RepID=A0A8X6TJA2_NEPPI|nr:hypothetical protein NPIL_354421 [Nephila pilipes]
MNGSGGEGEICGRSGVGFARRFPSPPGRKECGGARLRELSFSPGLIAVVAPHDRSRVGSTTHGFYQVPGLVSGIGRNARLPEPPLMIGARIIRMLVGYLTCDQDLPLTGCWCFRSMIVDQGNRLLSHLTLDNADRIYLHKIKWFPI